MTRGKYAARAANRLAEIDAGLVAELREKLTTVSRERNALRQELDRMRREQGAEAQRIAGALAAGRVSELEQALHDERSARAAERQEMARKTFQLLRVERAKLTFEAHGRLAAIFGMADKLGEILDSFAGEGRGNRNLRRVTRTTANLLGEVNKRSVSNRLELIVGDHTAQS